MPIFQPFLLANVMGEGGTHMDYKKKELNIIYSNGLFGKCQGSQTK